MVAECKHLARRGKKPPMMFAKRILGEVDCRRQDGRFFTKHTIYPDVVSIVLLHTNIFITIQYFLPLRHGYCHDTSPKIRFANIRGGFGELSTLSSHKMPHPTSLRSATFSLEKAFVSMERSVKVSCRLLLSDKHHVFCCVKIVIDGQNRYLCF